MERCEAAVQCPYDKLLHFHCAVNDRCHFATNYPSVMDSHVDEFHSNGATVPDGFEYFDVNFDCRMYRCLHRKVSGIIQLLSRLSWLIYSFYRHFTKNKKKTKTNFNSQNSSHYHCIRCQETIRKIMDLSNHECRSVISSQSNNFVPRTDLKLMQNNNNENVNGNSAGAQAPDYDDADSMDKNVGELSGNLTDSCGSEKMNVSDGTLSGQAEDKDKVSGKSILICSALVTHSICFETFSFCIFQLYEQLVLISHKILTTNK